MDTRHVSTSFYALPSSPQPLLASTQPEGGTELVQCTAVSSPLLQVKIHVPYIYIKIGWDGFSLRSLKSIYLHSTINNTSVSKLT